jgi:hypothetical protein
VTVYEPSGVVDEVGIFSVAVPDPPEVNVTLDGNRVGTKPREETVAESAMLPVKPLILARVIVVETEEPRRTGKDCGLAEIEKSCAAPTSTVIVVE